jgi:hypothetical protein
MGVLTLKCPATGLDFSTGINTDEATFKKLPNTVTKAACPHCGLTHSWWTREARLIEGTPPLSWSSEASRRRA